MHKSVRDVDLDVTPSITVAAIARRFVVALIHGECREPAVLDLIFDEKCVFYQS